MKSYKKFDLINPQSEFFRILRRLPQPCIEGPWIAGGSVWKAMEGLPIECDIDFFFKDEAQLFETKRLINSIPYVNRIVKEKQNRFNTTYDIHIFDRDYEKTVKVQFISFKKWPNPKELLDAFDFTACQFLLDGETIHVGDDSIEHLKTRKIILNRVKKSEMTLHHLQRYLDKGFTISDDQRKLLEDLKGVTNKLIIRNEETGNLEVRENVETDNDWTNYGRDIGFDVGEAQVQYAPYQTLTAPTPEIQLNGQFGQVEYNILTNNTTNQYIGRLDGTLAGNYVNLGVNPNYYTTHTINAPNVNMTEYVYAPNEGLVAEEPQPYRTPYPVVPTNY